MPRRDYSDEEIATALAFVEANNGDIKKVAARMKIPYITLYKWTRGHRKAYVSGATRGDVIVQKETEKRKSLADLFEEEAYAALAAANDVRDTAFYNHLVTGAAIAVDKMRLLREQPTTITADANTSPEDKLAAIQEALDKQGLPALKVIDGGRTGTDG